MKVSVLTVCFNNADTISETIQSVISQRHADLEYIIVDGGSTDRTLEIIEVFKSRISKVISEKDEGLYYALNKGIALCTGEVISILHADDVFSDENVIGDVVKSFTEKTEAVYGDLMYVNREDISKIIRYWKSGKYKNNAFVYGWMPPHPAFFVRRSVYDRLGKFNTALRSAADYEFMLRVIHKYNIGLTYLPRVLVKMRVGGTSNNSLRNRYKANREDKRAWELNGLKPGILTFILKPLRKILQYVNRP